VQLKYNTSFLYLPNFNKSFSKIKAYKKRYKKRKEIKRNNENISGLSATGAK